jgi:fructosamine-3-kinase
VAGGCIANGQRLDFSDGSRLFLKQSATLPPKMFAAEAHGLAALSNGDGPRVPQPLAHSPVDGGRGGASGFLVTEWIDSGRPGSSYSERFGRELAALHETNTAERFGFSEDNYIGSTPQPNRWTSSWSEFFREQRIGAQVRLARDHGRIGVPLALRIESILARLDALLPAPRCPALLHGDLWGGNAMCDSAGAPVIFDPAVYYGHPEADLAMTELFGGFGPRFYRAYDEVSPLEPGYAERRDLYNLYHMLNHVNLFGSGYLGSVTSIVRSYE